MLCANRTRPWIWLAAAPLVAIGCEFPKENPYPDREAKDRKKAAAEPDVSAAGSSPTLVE
jgi:hypothetical protein